MDSALTSVGLPIALAIIMFGLGLGLTVADFKRVGKHPRAVVVALTCQLVLLPAVCFGLVMLFDLDPLLGIGMLLLAASPGGTTANLYSHLFRGDVALNITLTAVNSIISIATLPLIANLAIDYFDQGDSVSMPLSEVLKVFVLILVPVGIGMLVRASRPAFARRMDRPVRIGVDPDPDAAGGRDPGLRARQGGRLVRRRGHRRRVVLRDQPGGRVRRAAGLRRGRGPGHRLLDGDRRPQRDAGDLRRRERARQRRDRRPGGGLLAR